MTREVGRQPWIIYGVLKTGDAASALPAYSVGGSLAIFFILYLILFCLFLLFARSIIKKGPQEDWR
jgi:cytochrome d ubiquinol oxidase subunit I